jgi:hypothetical protein
MAFLKSGGLLPDKKVVTALLVVNHITCKRNAYHDQTLRGRSVIINTFNTITSASFSSLCHLLASFCVQEDTDRATLAGLYMAVGMVKDGLGKGETLGGDIRITKKMEAVYRCFMPMDKTLFPEWRVRADEDGLGTIQKFDHSGQSSSYCYKETLLTIEGVVRGLGQYQYRSLVVTYVTLKSRRDNNVILTTDENNILDMVTREITARNLSSLLGRTHMGFCNL